MEPQSCVPFWFVAFVPGTKAWYHWFLKPGWQHVYAFAPLGPDRWLAVDPLWTHIAIAVLPGKTVDLMINQAVRTGIVLRVRTSPRQVRFRFLLTCVTFVKHLVGDTSRAVTPWQLYRSLERNGATRAFHGAD